MLSQSEEAHVREILAGLEVYPAYYVHMSAVNRANPTEPDLRTRTAFAAGHLPGSFNFGADGPFSTYLGWMIRWGTPVTLLGQSEEQVSAGQRELARIGIDLVTAVATGKPEEWSTDRPAGYATAGFADLAEVRHHRTVSVLDVRRASEHQDSHIEGAVNIPIHEIPDRLEEAPEGEVWVHCGSGYRASIAASFLAAAGRTVVVVDDAFDHAADAGLRLTG